MECRNHLRPAVADLGGGAIYLLLTACIRHRVRLVERKAAKLSAAHRMCKQGAHGGVEIFGVLPLACCAVQGSTAAAASQLQYSGGPSPLTNLDKS